MTCQACEAAKPDPCGSVHLRADCDDCRARVLAATGAHVESLRLGTMTAEYRGMLERVFGERWQAGHELVKGWGALIEQQRRQRKAATAVQR